VERELSAADAKRFAGMYANGSQKIVLVEKGGRLSGTIGDAQYNLMRLGPARLRARNANGSPGPQIDFVLGSDGRVEYMTLGLRALARVN
jgi:hypothetical protein